MRTLHLLLRILVLVTIAACGDYPLPPVEQSVELHYPPGVNGVLPHGAPGQTVQLSALVTDHKGRPVEAATVYWDDGYAPIRLFPTNSPSDSTGIATTLWTLPELGSGQVRAQPTVRASLPGAGSLTFRIEVLPCSRCDDNPQGSQVR